MTTTVKYHEGFGSHVSSEALPGALPKGQNSPQLCPYGLYAEQLSGTPFTAPREKNLRSWLYRIRPSVVHGSFTPLDSTLPSSHENFVVDPTELRWDPPKVVDPSIATVDFVDGLSMVCGAGDASLKEGISIFNFSLNSPMLTSSRTGRVMCNADGDLLIVPQLGGLEVSTEFGLLIVEPCEIVVVPRGIKFSVNSTESDGISRGYALEVFNGHFELPSLGPIGANGLANPRDFQIPSARFEDKDGDGVAFVQLQKFGGKFFSCTMQHNPFDVVAWHGNYYPFKYDLRKFNCMNTVSFDHPDPSIYTVLTVPTSIPGTAAVDFVIFPPRWMVAMHTFRPPYYHRNCMSEYMGMIHGVYDAKAGGFVPGGASLHSCGTAHGPDAITFQQASTQTLAPVYFDAGLAFMFETMYTLKVSHEAMSSSSRQKDYAKCWQPLVKHFTGDPAAALKF